VRSSWKWIRYRLEWIGLLLATRLIPLLPRSFCLRLARIVGWLMSILDRHSFQVALANLDAAFGNELSIQARRKIARASFQHFARAAIDFLWSPRLTRENLSQFIELENFEETARNTGPERSILIACYHYSNFEWLSLACGFLGLTGTIITQDFKNALLDPIFKRIRELSGHEIIPRERGIIRLYKILRRKGRTAVLVDLTIPPRQGAVAIDCFGLKTSVTAAHAWLHQETGVPIIPAHCEPLPDGRYRLVFHPRIVVESAVSAENAPGTAHATAELRDIAQACWNSFEPYVRRNPAPWLWMYKHWRYSPANTARKYPFYAGVSPNFEELL
jgi:KDO2-lipid IV(A) lauroyltransferase